MLPFFSAPLFPFPVMSSNAPLPRRPRLVGPRKTFAIVASSYNEEFVNGLLEAMKSELLAIMPSASIPLYHVPGAWEIPVTTEYVLEYTVPDVIIAVGVIIQGDTSHADLIATAVAEKLMEQSTRHLTPVINCVLSMKNEEQAHERCLGVELNRGIECARAALNMAELFQKLHTAYPTPRKAKQADNE
jgi:6,7-dimethyl-8-ribityllumazine synthase